MMLAVKGSLVGNNLWLIPLVGAALGFWSGRTTIWPVKLASVLAWAVAALFVVWLGYDLTLHPFKPNAILYGAASMALAWQALFFSIGFAAWLFSHRHIP